MTGNENMRCSLDHLGTSLFPELVSFQRGALKLYFSTRFCEQPSSFVLALTQYPAEPEVVLRVHSPLPKLPDTPFRI